jgi:GTP pyrophosphokinase
MVLSSRLSEALAYAATLHAEQKRKVSGAPYLGHLLRVAGIVLEHGADEDEAIAALLHDAIEDQGGAVARTAIRQQFGSRVADLVDSCSDSDQTPKPPWRRRKETYLERLRHAPASVCLITAADKLDNVRSLLRDYRTHGPSLWRHFKGGREGTLWYHRSALEILRQRGGSPLVDELACTVAQLEEAVSEGPPSCS